MRSIHAILCSSLAGSGLLFGATSLTESFQGGSLPAGFSEADTVAADGAIAYTVSGAEFGSVAASDAGRNYIRTGDADYAGVPFTAYLTIEAEHGLPNSWAGNEQFFFGLGAGDRGQYNVPDRNTPNSSVFVEMHPSASGTSKWRVSANNDGSLSEGLSGFHDYPADTGSTFRIRMTLNPMTQVMNFGMDYDYAGGPYAEDATSGDIDISTLYGATGWDVEPSRVFFGGDGTAEAAANDPMSRAYDLSVEVVPEPSVPLLAGLGLALALVHRRTRA